MKKLLLTLALVQLTLYSFAQKTTQDLSSFITLDNVLMALGLLTPVLTAGVKKLFKTDGAETVIANVIINLFAKAFLMVFTGQATWGFALVWFVFGVLFDKGLHAAIKGQSSGQVLR